MASVILTVSSILAIVAGLLILFFPRIFRIALGIYLLLLGILGILELNAVI